MRFEPPAEISSHLERRLEGLVQRNVLVRDTLRRCQDSLMFKLQEPSKSTARPSQRHPGPLHGSPQPPHLRGPAGGARPAPGTGGAGHPMELEDLKNEIEKRQAKNATRFPENSQLDTEAQGREEKNQQPDIRSAISRCGKVTFQLPADASPGLEERSCHFSWRNGALKEALRKLQAPVTLDPDTAHPDLILSEDGKCVRRGSSRRPVPASPQRFESWPFVLGCQGFAAGRHCWDVEVGESGDWALGAARDSIQRRGRLSLSPRGGIWGLERWGGQVRALTARRVTLLPLRCVPRRVRVHLDYGAGTVAFFDADGGGLLFVFSRAAFNGERVRPWLWVVGAGSQLRLCP